MQLKKFQAPTINEALQKIKAELGEDAVIFDLRTRCTSGNNGVSKETWVEVTAAVDRNCTNLDGGNRRPSPVHSETPARPQVSMNMLRLGATEGLLAGAATRYSPYLQNMLLSGFTQASAGYLIGETAAVCASASHEKAFECALQERIERHLCIAGPITVNAGQKKRVAFIGPTGVGKTTTLAKIAAQFTRRRDLRIRIITIDTYRIAAAEQLKVYGKLMNLPVLIVESIQDFDQALQRCGDADLILIDTAGRNYRDAERMATLGSWLAQYPDIETHLLLSATTTPAVLNATVQCFLRNRVNCLIITKIDESIGLGHLYDTLVETGLPISYLTNGQRVPEDILPARAPLVAELLLHGYPEPARAAV